MKEFKGKVAVITGGATGIGRAMAERFAEEGMRIVLADVEADVLEKTAEEMRAEGAEVLSIACDISKREEVEHLANETVKAFSTVHVLCNNAGVGSGGYTWEIELDDWDWVLDVNLKGVVYGIHYFTPIMMKNGDACHIVNTASICGLINVPRMSAYNVAKHGVVSISETMHKELEETGSKVRISVLCPGWVNTRIHESDRNRPQGEFIRDESNVEAMEYREKILGNLRDGASPIQVAQAVFDGIKAEQFYILPQPHLRSDVEIRMRDILDNQNPTIAELFGN